MLVRCCQVCVFSKMTSCKQIHSSTVGRHKPSLIQQQDINVINDVLNIANQMKIDLNLTHPEFRTLVNFIIFLNSTPYSHAFYEKFLNRQLRYPGSYKRSLLLEQAIICFWIQLLFLLLMPLQKLQILFNRIYHN